MESLKNLFRRNVELGKQFYQPLFLSCETIKLQKLRTCGMTFIMKTAGVQYF